MAFDSDWLIPDWDAPHVGAVMTTRRGGFSTGPYESLNLRHGIGDSDAAVAQNRARLQAAVQAPIGWLTQVHGTTVRTFDAADASWPEADGGVTRTPNLACAVQVADCVPVLFAAPSAVGAAHAGWRGLAAGVLEATLHALCRESACQPAEVQAWIGPCIGPARFEVGEDVLLAFGQSAHNADARRFAPRHDQKWLADLPLLARDRLLAAGVERTTGGHWCTVSDPQRFFSFRRDRGTTGRMAGLVWLR